MFGFVVETMKLPLRSLKTKSTFKTSLELFGDLLGKYKLQTKLKLNTSVLELLRVSNFTSAIDINHKL